MLVGGAVVMDVEDAVVDETVVLDSEVELTLSLLEMLLTDDDD